MSKTETQSDALTAERRLFITAVANLELRKKFGDEGFRLDLERDELEALIEMAERVSRLDAENKALRAAIGDACDGWNMHPDLRKHLETALWAKSVAAAKTGDAA